AEGGTVGIVFDVLGAKGRRRVVGACIRVALAHVRAIGVVFHPSGRRTSAGDPGVGRSGCVVFGRRRRVVVIRVPRGDEVRAGVVITAHDDGGRGGVLDEVGRGGLGGQREEAAIAVPGAERIVVGGAAPVDDVAGVVEVEGADDIASPLDAVDVAGLERERDGLRHEDAGVLKVAVHVEGDGDEAGGV